MADGVLSATTDEACATHCGATIPLNASWARQHLSINTPVCGKRGRIYFRYSFARDATEASSWDATTPPLGTQTSEMGTFFAWPSSLRPSSSKGLYRPTPW